MPDLVLYSDGQLMRATSTGYEETMLSGAETDTLLSNITSAGFFQVEQVLGTDNIYQFDKTPPMVDGDISYVIRINAEISKTIIVYRAYEEFVIQPVKTTLKLLRNYRPQAMRPFSPNRILLYIEKGQFWDQWCVNYVGGTPAPTPAPSKWPHEFPSLAEWLGNKTNNVVYIQGNLAEQIYHVSPLCGAVDDNGTEYYVIARPLLPHESSTEFEIPSLRY